MAANMATLATNAPLSALAQMIHAARALGHDAWNGGGASPRPAGRDELSDDIRELFTLLNQRGVPYLLVGGVALLKYTDGRNTEDIDLLLSVESLQAIPEIALTDQNKDFGRGRFRNLRVDLLFSGNPVFRLVGEKYATSHQFAELEVRCATVEGLVLLKLYALPSLYRQGDGQKIGLYENDIFMLCQRNRPDTKAILEKLKPHVDADAHRELCNIMAEIERRIARVERRLQ
jgi:hypothetical protein